MLDAVSDFLRFLDLCLQLGEVRCIILLRRWLQKVTLLRKDVFM